MKANKFSLHSLIGVILALVMVLLPNAAQATITLAAAILSDTNGNGVANIGEIVTLSCNSSQFTAGFTPRAVFAGNTIILPPIGTASFCSYIYTVSAGGADTNGVADPVNFYDENSGPIPAFQGVAVDNQLPQSFGANFNAGFPPSGTNGEYIYGNTFAFDISFTDTDGAAGPPRLNAFADLSSLGFSSAVRLNFSAGAYHFAQALTLPAEVKAPEAVKVTAYDDAGNAAQFFYTPNFTLDTKRPVINSATVTNLDGHTITKVGDRLQITVVVNNYDNETVTASQSSLLPTSPVDMGAPTVSGTTATYN